MTELTEILNNLAKAIENRNPANDANAHAAETWADELEAVARQLRQGASDGNQGES